MLLGLFVLLALQGVNAGCKSSMSSTCPIEKFTQDLGEFRLGRSLGSGSFGVVNLAIEKSHPEKFLAVKRPLRSDKAAFDDLIRESILIELARTGESVRGGGSAGSKYILACKHETIKPTISRSETAISSTGIQQPILVCELAAGELELFIEPLPPLKTAAKLLKAYANADCLFWQLLAGMHQMHENGIAHRDLKPANILFTIDAANEKELEITVKIADFGLGLYFPSSIRPKARRVEDGSAAGTTSFMPPELLVRRPRPYDPFLQDVWAAAVTLLHFKNNELADDLIGRGVTSRDQFSKLMAQITTSSSRSSAAASTGFKITDADQLQLIVGMLDLRPEERFKSSQIVSSAWFTKMEGKCASIKFPTTSKQ